MISDSRRLERAEMSDWQKVNICQSLYWPSRFSCPSCTFFSSSCRCFSTCFLACLASSIFSMPILTLHPDPGDHAGQSDTGGHREYGEPSLHTRNCAVSFLIHGPLHPTLLP